MFAVSCYCYWAPVVHFESGMMDFVFLKTQIISGWAGDLASHLRYETDLG